LLLFLMERVHRYLEFLQSSEDWRLVSHMIGKSWQ
jgi:hypothetical protein